MGKEKNASPELYSVDLEIFCKNVKNKLYFFIIDEFYNFVFLMRHVQGMAKINELFMLQILSNILFLSFRRYDAFVRNPMNYFFSISQFG
ncbi:Uncharacterised protein [Actinobacillus seminis]|uniref:Uncharacterized protein n=1 Tax=Actinobacillus seminis TaxID=722 RepID=A0A380VIV8_9PAST|nr:hypothetical protein [Actinobacillus seminis]SUU38518.1 Uncharacterised protein [Actinobacillus seminis]